MDSHTDELNVFDQRALAILQYLKKDLRYDLNSIPPPVFFEITGTASAGKTTMINDLDTFFRRLGFRVRTPLEGAKEIRHVERTSPLYNIRTGIYALTLLMDYMHGHLYDLVIFDRCIFDAYCWMIYWQEKQLLSQEEMIFFQSFFLSRFWVNQITASYFVICDPEVACARENEHAVSKRLGQTTNPETIAKLVRQYRSAYEKLSPIYPQLQIIDTTNLNITEMNELIAKRTLDAIERTMHIRQQ